MITFSKIDTSSVTNFVRSLKTLQFGVKTAVESAPFGDDAAPLKDMIAIFADTSNNAEPVIIGYINKNQLAGPGEKRIYSLQSNGDLSAWIWLKGDETIEIFGNQKNMVRYQELETAFNELKDKFNELITAYNAHTHIAVGLGSPTSTPSAVGTPSAADITPAKIENIKTN